MLIVVWPIFDNSLTFSLFSPAPCERRVCGAVGTPWHVFQDCLVDKSGPTQYDRSVVVSCTEPHRGRLHRNIFQRTGTCARKTLCYLPGYLPGVATPVLLKYLCSHRVSRTSVLEETHPRLFQSLRTILETVHGTCIYCVLIQTVLSVD